MGLLSYCVPWKKNSKILHFEKFRELPTSNVQPKIQNFKVLASSTNILRKLKKTSLMSLLSHYITRKDTLKFYILKNWKVRAFSSYILNNSDFFLCLLFVCSKRFKKKFVLLLSAFFYTSKSHFKNLFINANVF